MQKILPIKISTILVIGAIVMIYFLVHWHYWLAKLLGGYYLGNKTLLPIMVLFCAFVFREFVSFNSGGKINRKIFYLLIPLFCYTCLALCSTVFNEEGFDNIRRYFIYIYSPIIIFISILGLHIYKKNGNIKSTLNVLFICGVLLSIYVAFINLDPQSIINMPPIETSSGIMWHDTGASYGINEKLQLLRHM